METHVSKHAKKEPVRQFSIFADNKVGRLNEIVHRLGAADVHIMAFSQLDTTECTIMRFIFDDWESATEVLCRFRYPHAMIEVIAVEINSEAEIRKVTAALVEAEINIHYVYPFVMRPREKSALAMAVEDNDLAAQVLRTCGLKVLEGSDIYR